jgi:hypothetical protein
VRKERRIAHIFELLREMDTVVDPAITPTAIQIEEAGVALILVDDVRYIEGLQSAVDRCAETFGYTLHSSPFAADDNRGIAVLVKD